MENDPYGQYVLRNWHLVPWWAKIKIYVMITWYSWRSQIGV